MFLFKDNHGSNDLEIDARVELRDVSFSPSAMGSFATWSDNDPAACNPSRPFFSWPAMSTVFIADTVHAIHPRVAACARGGIGRGRAAAGGADAADSADRAGGACVLDAETMRARREAEDRRKKCTGLREQRRGAAGQRGRDPGDGRAEVQCCCCCSISDGAGRAASQVGRTAAASLLRAPAKSLSEPQANTRPPAVTAAKAP